MRVNVSAGWDGLQRVFFRERKKQRPFACLYQSALRLTVSGGTVTASRLAASEAMTVPMKINLCAGWYQ
jgi:hypothetical protein